MNQRIMTFGFALLVVLLIGLGIRFFSDSETASFATSEQEITGTPIRSATSESKILATETVLPQVEILALCRGSSPIVMNEACRDQFAGDGFRLGLGEMVILNPSLAGSSAQFEFRFDEMGEPRPGYFIDSAITKLDVDTRHTVQIRLKGGPWSEPFEFGVALLFPLPPVVTNVCVESRCAPRVTLPFIPNPRADAFYPVLVTIHGFMQGKIYEYLDQSYLWAELMLDGNNVQLGCDNCDVAELSGVLYPHRPPFGDTGYFYDWDVSSLKIGEHIMQARFRNNLYIGPWSEPFIFEVK